MRLMTSEVLKKILKFVKMKKAVKEINDLRGMEIWLQINIFSALYLRMIQKYLFIVGDLKTLESLSTSKHWRLLQSLYQHISSLEREQQAEDLQMNTLRRPLKRFSLFGDPQKVSCLQQVIRRSLAYRKLSEGVRSLEFLKMFLPIEDPYKSCIF